ncbi:MAG: FRG domain-containing protein [Smithella sp.]
MKRTPQTNPFPHTEYETKRPPDSKIDDLWDNLINFLAYTYLDPNKWGWVFRGLRKYSYKLESTIERRLKRRSKGRRVYHDKGDPYISLQIAEDYLLCQFKRAIHHFVGSSLLPDNSDNRLEWLALMQHYGAPTRLLDFTRSPYVACFFALEETDIDKGKKCAIWAIHTDWLIKASLPLISIEGQSDIKQSNLLDSEFIAKHFDRLFVNNSVPMILPIEPPRSNPRLLVQQGLFLCPGALDRSFDENLSSYANDINIKNMQQYVHKIKIEGRIFAEAMSELHYMNISRASLFPDLEGFGTSLAHKLEHKSSDEIKTLR